MTGETRHSAERSRDEIARSAAARIASASVAELAGLRAFVGFDGFVDSIIRVVDVRRSMAADDYEPIGTLSQLAERVGAAAGKSANMELVVTERRFGGNGPLLAGGLGRLGAPVTYVGAVGREDDPSTLDPIYAPFAERCDEVIPVAAPGQTDALEFDDGKLMLGKPASLQGVTWESLVARVGLDALRARLKDAKLIAVVNWVMMGGVESIWRGLINDVLGGREGPPVRVFIDLCDPAKREDEDLRRALRLLGEVQEVARVTLGLNLSEAQRIAAVLGVDPSIPLREMAAQIRSSLGFSCVAVHPREGAAAADDEGSSAWFDGPFTARPRLSTGAGDHFNAGFCFAQLLGMPLEECLATGCAESGAYVRDAESPTRERLGGFLADLPAPETPGRC